MDLAQPSTFSGLEKVHKYLGCALTFHQLNAKIIELTCKYQALER
jgi:hypothetical protein